MGIVLRARDTKLERVVGIKLLARPLAITAPARQRFVREARAAAAISHDNVIAIYAVEDDSPQPYLVMQFIDGPTLQAKLDRSGRRKPTGADPSRHQAGQYPAGEWHRARQDHRLRPGSRCR